MSSTQKPKELIGKAHHHDNHIMQLLATSFAVPWQLAKECLVTFTRKKTLLEAVIFIGQPGHLWWEKNYCSRDKRKEFVSIVCLVYNMLVGNYWHV